MTYEDGLTHIAGNFSILLAIFFCFIFIFGKSEHKILSSILLLSSLFASLLEPIPPELYTTNPSLYLDRYLDNMGSLITIDGGAGLVLTMFLANSKVIVKQSFLLLFLIIVHFMVIYALTIERNIFAVFCYSWYAEITILIGVLQMVVSRDGFSGALGGIQSFIHWLGVHYYNGREAFFAYIQSWKGA